MTEMQLKLVFHDKRFIKAFNNFEDIEYTTTHTFNVPLIPAPATWGSTTLYTSHTKKREVNNTLYTTTSRPMLEGICVEYTQRGTKECHYQLKYNFNKEDTVYIITTMATFIEV